MPESSQLKLISRQETRQWQVSLNSIKSKAGEFRFRLKVGNGENILSSEGYKEKGGVENRVASVRRNAAEKDRFEVKDSTSGNFYFVLKAANHQVIGQSQMYKAKSSAESGVESVMNNAPEASLDDQAGRFFTDKV